MAMTILFGRMAEIPVGLKPRMRELSEGPALEWGFWGWTHHDGSTWAALGFEGATVTADHMLGWAAMTQQVDVLPVVGCYVAPEARGRGAGELLLGHLLRALVNDGVLHKRDRIAAATGRWSKYPAILKSCGLRCVTWGAEQS